MRDFRRLDVWHEGIALARSVYQATATFPRAERYGLTAQMRSAAVSISSNIAEGAGRGSPREMGRFLQIAVGSACELDSQIELAISLSFLAPETHLVDQTDILRRRIARLLQRVLAEA